MKFFLLFILAACASPSSAPRTGSAQALQALKEKDQLILESLDEEPLRQGTMKKEVEGPITTEVWSWTEEHGSPYTRTETLMYKNGELVSHTLRDPEQGLTLSRQFRKGQVIQVNEERKDHAESVFLDSGKITGRMTTGKNPECVTYDGGVPAFREMSVCEERFNTAP